RVLQGVGASLALPLLDSMVPAGVALAQTAARPVPRFSLVYVPNGINMAAWTPTSEGSGLELGPTLEALTPYRDRMTLVSGLNLNPAKPLPGEGVGPHARAGGAFLTGAHPKRTEGPDVRAGVSVDQI